MKLEHWAGYFLVACSAFFAGVLMDIEQVENPATKVIFEQCPKIGIDQ